MRKACVDAECRLKPEMNGLRGLIVRSYLPSVWVFSTEKESATLLISVMGNMHVHQGRPPEADMEIDVEIEWTHELLKAVLRDRGRSSIPEFAYPKIYARTTKGRQAFNFLKDQFGL